MISANGGLLAHRYTPQVTPRWPRGSEPASQDALCLGLVLVDYVYHHGVFVNPGIGIYLQRVGSTMGTNAAPPWAQLVLRMFEILTPLPNNHFLNRYIDDGLILHPLEHSSD